MSNGSNKLESTGARAIERDAESERREGKRLREEVQKRNGAQLVSIPEFVSTDLKWTCRAPRFCFGALKSPRTSSLYWRREERKTTDIIKSRRSFREQLGRKRMYVFGIIP